MRQITQKPKNPIIAISQEHKQQDQFSQMVAWVEAHGGIEKIESELEKWEKREEELETLLFLSIDLIAIFNNMGRFIKVSDSWKTILGWTEEELLNMSWRDIIHPDDMEISYQASRQRVDGPRCKKVVNRYRCKEGNYRWIEWNGCHIEKEEALFVCSGRDITYEKEIEEKERLLQEALQLEQLKSEFFANISHELRTPITIIKAATQLFNQSLDEDKMVEGVYLKKYVDSIKQNSNRLLRLVNNLIDMTKIDAGYYEIHLENHNIVSVVEDITMSVVEYVEGKAIELIFDTEIEEAVIACDPDKVERIMLNLLSNAIKYSPEFGQIQVYIEQLDHEIRIAVSDNGVGIPENRLQYIFNRFTQVDNTLTRKCEGSGIGLSLVKSLVEMHGGHVWAQSQLNGGTTVTFSLPIKQVTQDIDKMQSSKIITSNIERCVIEFSDIYHL
ncbi:PAS domain-containing sensor histidine kinase [Niameybacter massiliensis]|uniref:histidine kinase n=1 Tax=Holtiella tumoricola TaxID=3018743 RepID=A0AA42J2V7_9FIRM|nr:PAS domain-containing sensor histidine kinase [Holtiella tumoricola]MDA3733576.1 PAS domain-containing sensor histidine kinase [Holtiella tumoricola]